MTTAASSTVRLWQISDSHCYPDDSTALEWSKETVYPNQSLRAVLDHLQTTAADHAALFITGDLAQEETAQTYQRTNELLADFPRPVYVLPGNHDIPELMQANLGGKVTLPTHVAFGQCTRCCWIPIHRANPTDIWMKRNLPNWNSNYALFLSKHSPLS